MPTIVWEEPEVIVKKKSKNELLLEALMENPGKWGRIKTSKTLKAAQQGMFKVRDDAKKNYPGHWEFTARQLKNNYGAIYGRYVGETYQITDSGMISGFTIST